MHIDIFIGLYLSFSIAKSQFVSFFGLFYPSKSIYDYILTQADKYNDYF